MKYTIFVKGHDNAISVPYPVPPEIKDIIYNWAWIIPAHYGVFSIGMLVNAITNSYDVANAKTKHDVDALKKYEEVTPSIEGINDQIVEYMAQREASSVRVLSKFKDSPWAAPALPQKERLIISVFTEHIYKHDLVIRVNKRASELVSRTITVKQ